MLPGAQPVLPFALQHGDVSMDVLQLLLDNDTTGAVNALDNLGRTALMIAAQHKSMRIIQLLIQHNANVHVADNGGATALVYCFRTTNGTMSNATGQLHSNVFANAKVAQALLDRGASVKRESLHELTQAYATDKLQSDFLHYYLKWGVAKELLISGDGDYSCIDVALVAMVLCVLSPLLLLGFGLFSICHCAYFPRVQRDAICRIQACVASSAQSARVKDELGQADADAQALIATTKAETHPSLLT